MGTVLAPLGVDYASLLGQVDRSVALVTLAASVPWWHALHLL
jgi:hypothetical protein